MRLLGVSTRDRAQWGSQRTNMRYNNALWIPAGRVVLLPWLLIACHQVVHFSARRTLRLSLASLPCIARGVFVLKMNYVCAEPVAFSERNELNSYGFVLPVRDMRFQSCWIHGFLIVKDSTGHGS